MPSLAHPQTIVSLFGRASLCLQLARYSCRHNPCQLQRKVAKPIQASNSRSAERSQQGDVAPTPPTWYISFFCYCWEGQASSCRIWKFLASKNSLISRRLSKQFRQLLPLGVLQSQPIEFLHTKFSHIYLSFEYGNDEDFVQECLCGLSIWVSTIQRVVSPGSLRVIEGNLLQTLFPA